MPFTTPEQEHAIDAQAESYGTAIGSRAAGLNGYKVSPAPIPSGAVLVSFDYIPMGRRDHAHEVVTFAADGTVIDSRDLG